MLVDFLALAHETSTPGLGLNIGTLLSGIAAMLLAIGATVGAIARFRKATKQVKLQAHLDSVNAQAARESIKSIKEGADRLTAQYEARLAQNTETIHALHHVNDEQRHLYEERLANQQALINTLLAQILKQRK